MDHSSNAATATVTEESPSPVRERARSKPRRQPRYHVILWDDNDHSYDYVIHMMNTVFGFPYERAYQIARNVDTQGRAVCLTTTKEHAELKRDQIHSFGKDGLIASCSGSMSSSIEPIE